MNIGSLAGRGSSSATLLANFGSPSYYAMKASLINYTQTLAERLGPHNVNVNCICPGVVPTDAWETHKQRAVQTMPEFNEMDPDEWFDGVVQDRYPHIFRTIPLRRETSVDDIAQAVLFLVSEDGKNITGQSINVDGGAVKS